MLVFRMLCRITQSSDAHRTESVSVMDHEQTMRVSSIVLDQKRQNISDCTVCCLCPCPVWDGTLRASCTIRVVSTSENPGKSGNLKVFREKLGEVWEVLLAVVCNTVCIVIVISVDLERYNLSTCTAIIIRICHLSRDYLKHFYLPNPFHWFNFSPCNLCTVS